VLSTRVVTSSKRLDWRCTGSDNGAVSCCGDSRRRARCKKVLQTFTRFSWLVLTRSELRVPTAKVVRLKLVEGQKEVFVFREETAADREAPDGSVR